MFRSFHYNTKIPEEQADNLAHPKIKQQTIGHFLGAKSHIFNFVPTASGLDFSLTDETVFNPCS